MQENRARQIEMSISVGVPPSPVFRNTRLLQSAYVGMGSPTVSMASLSIKESKKDRRGKAKTKPIVPSRRVQKVSSHRGTAFVHGMEISTSRQLPKESLTITKSAAAKDHSKSRPTRLSRFLGKFGIGGGKKDRAQTQEEVDVKGQSHTVSIALNREESRKFSYKSFSQELPRPKISGPESQQTLQLYLRRSSSAKSSSSKLVLVPMNFDHDKTRNSKSHQKPTTSGPDAGMSLNIQLTKKGSTKKPLRGILKKTAPVVVKKEDSNDETSGPLWKRRMIPAPFPLNTIRRMLVSEDRMQTKEPLWRRRSIPAPLRLVTNGVPPAPLWKRRNLEEPGKLDLYAQPRQSRTRKH